MARDPWERERIEPMRHRLAHGQLREHLARYRFAAEVLQGRVLDAGCGTGYGTALLAAAPRVGEALGIDAGVRLQWVARLGAAPDHPVHLDHPEGEYLKGLLLRSME